MREPIAKLSRSNRTIAPCFVLLKVICFLSLITFAYFLSISFDCVWWYARLLVFCVSSRPSQLRKFFILFIQKCVLLFWVYTMYCIVCFLCLGWLALIVYCFVDIAYYFLCLFGPIFRVCIHGVLSLSFLLLLLHLCIQSHSQTNGFHYVILHNAATQVSLFETKPCESIREVSRARFV